MICLLQICDHVIKGINMHNVHFSAWEVCRTQYAMLTCAGLDQTLCTALVMVSCRLQHGICLNKIIWNSHG